MLPSPFHQFELPMKTLLEVLLHETHAYTYLKVFGCACWPHTRSYNNYKLDFWSKKCVFLGYSSLHKDYKCLHVPSNRVFISRDVIFYENVFPFSALPTPSTPPTHRPSPGMPNQFEDVAHSPLFLPNHGAGIGRGARLHLEDMNDTSPDAPYTVDGPSSSAMPSMSSSSPLPGAAPTSVVPSLAPATGPHPAAYSFVPPSAAPTPLSPRATPAPDAASTS
jgi:histone deacetylase 1/2